MVCSGTHVVDLVSDVFGLVLSLTGYSLSSSLG